MRLAFASEKFAQNAFCEKSYLVADSDAFVADCGGRSLNHRLHVALRFVTEAARRQLPRQVLKCQLFFKTIHE